MISHLLDEAELSSEDLKHLERVIAQKRKDLKEK
jgi:hypothetical protein